MLNTPPADSSLFPTAHCAACEKTVLTYVTLDANGEERRACVHCDGRIETKLEWLDADDLVARGYSFGSGPQARNGGGGCGGGCGGGGCAMRAGGNGAQPPQGPGGVKDGHS